MWDPGPRLHAANLEHHGGHGEEVHGDEGLDVIGQEGVPGLRRGLPMAHQILGHRRLRDLDAQLPEFPVNPRRTPEGVGLGHPLDERSDRRGDNWTAWPVPAALPRPEEREAGSVPSDHGGGWTMETASAQPLQSRDSRTQNSRSERRNRGRGAVR